jgi:hypothetical protein
VSARLLGRPAARGQPDPSSAQATSRPLRLVAGRSCSERLSAVLLQLADLVAQRVPGDASVTSSKVDLSPVHVGRTGRGYLFRREPTAGGQPHRRALSPGLSSAVSVE